MIFLTLESFNKAGGLQCASRILGKALNDLSLAGDRTFKMISLCDEGIKAENGYVDPLNFKGFSYKRISFFLSAFRHGSSTGTVILSHINLLSVAYLIKLFKPDSRIILIAHGKEVWTHLQQWKRKFINGQAEVWAVSQFTKDSLIKKNGIKADNIQVLNNCLDPYFKIPSDFSKPTYLLDRYDLSDADRVILSISRINVYERNKGYDQVLDCIPELSRRFPGIKYMLAGKVDITERSRILKKIKDLGITKQVILTGFIAEDELSDHYLLCDLFIMPSTKEGFGLVFLEALACGRQVIAGNKDGSRDAVLHGALGTLINPESKREICYAISTCLLKSRNEGASELQREALKHFNFDAYKLRVDALLKHTKTTKLKSLTHLPEIQLK